MDWPNVKIVISMTNLELIMAEAPIIPVRKEKKRVKKDVRKRKHDMLDRPTKEIKVRRY
jgi:hypothetical protein